MPAAGGVPLTDKLVVWPGHTVEGLAAMLTVGKGLTVMVLLVVVDVHPP